jgi:uncharacterized protein YvpB/subtilisin-like proprotein convertase family protein
MSLKFTLLSITLMILAAILLFGASTPVSAGALPEELPLATGLSTHENPGSDQAAAGLSFTFQVTGTVTNTVSTIHLPIISWQAVEEKPSEIVFACSYPNLGIQDNQISDMILVGNNRSIVDMDIFLKIPHQDVGDLIVTLTHVESGRSAVLLDQPGAPDNAPYGTFGCPHRNVQALLNDEAILPAEDRCSPNPTDYTGRQIPAISGSFVPTQGLSYFDGDILLGNWELSVTDNVPEGVGTLEQWCIRAKVGIPEEAPPPVDPSTLPLKASIAMYGQSQAMPLDCESRSAVDWAAAFGYQVGEFDFFDRLPASDNPETGFVGNVWGDWGQTPPNDYGVHAGPIAENLLSYGVPAYPQYFLSWDRMRQEIANGRPVMVWVIGSTIFDGVPEMYVAGDGQVSQVARYQHTAIVTGYDDENGNVTILDGAKLYKRSYDDFLTGWSALGNMAVTATP